MEKCIQYLRELAMLEVVYGDLDDEQLPKDPDEVRCTRPMWQKLKLSRKVQQLKEDMSCSPPVRTSISAIRSQCSSAEETGYSGYTPRGTLWFYLHDHGGDMRKWDGKPTLTLEPRLIHRLESQGVISKTRSPFNSPIWPVQKSNGEWRLTVDYCGLNEVMPPPSAAVLDMLELQYELESKAAKWYATTDIANVHKKLGCGTARIVDPNWPKGYSIPYDVMLSI
ncbi:hypothetical protein QYF61_002012 [Mycteria americana]|uniref:Uncharacterized protein n=1 Tax=Mycteria americana TaxID=33587 RepID=A0AAN7SI71_MYCAM|nr:hypothetical protein QYF61_002012 [Mycteria americana]